ncbi:alpha-L-rhamnosidase C-terminal domain-containing protein [Xanthocytophaga flavus]|nr:alpha-L-rhamnosidase C-terminal domain-containing protein [Xanthocytophaga flavus]
MLGYWISSLSEKSDKPNTWIAFRQDIILPAKPSQAIAMIATDTKYWLWINGQLILFEGGLKRGPNPQDTYYDKVDLAPYLKKGNNQIAILVWHLGKDGFSHLNSGRAGLFFSMQADKVTFYSDNKWVCRIHPAYSTTDEPSPNFRLPESNIRFDARNDMGSWQTMSLNSLPDFKAAQQIGRPGDAPWNGLVERPIPQWKDFGIKKLSFKRHHGNGIDTIFAPLPYNMQMTPIIIVKDNTGGHRIGISTDHSVAGGTNNLRAEYITTKGYQEYESYGWLNGEKILLTVASDIEVIAIKYRQTGYNTEPVGSFTCSDEFYNLFWKKALRTLYVNMRDNYFDCPDRERAQWWADAVLLMGESFYTYSTSTHALMRKAIHELAAWQRTEGELFSPIPGNFNKELPDQMLTSIGYYGFWNYYLNTGDRKTIEEVYPAVKKYLSLWKTDDTGLTVLRQGDWLWGDWGDNKDIRLIIAGWHYLALDGAAKMADLLDKDIDATGYRLIMGQVKAGYNKCWNGYAYRHSSYQGKTDDRVQAIAVISGIADLSKYPSILAILKTQFHASPYMEKYVMEALFVMGQGKYALQRTKERFSEMVKNPDYTTLFEGWGIGERGFGGGTTNHAWSGGAQIVIAQCVFGVKPLQAAYKTFLVEPNPATFTSGSLTVPTVKGMISVSFEKEISEFQLKLTVPTGTTAIVRLGKDVKVYVNKKLLTERQLCVEKQWQKASFTTFKLFAGEYFITTKKGV